MSPEEASITSKKKKQHQLHKRSFQILRRSFLICSEGKKSNLIKERHTYVESCTQRATTEYNYCTQLD